MSYVDEEIASQPDCWRAAAEVGFGETPLPRRGTRVAVVGCGTSLFMAQAYAALREGAGHGETDAFAASEFPAGRGYDQVVALTRSGTTTEVLELLRRLSGTVPTVAVTADPNTPVMDAADDVIVLGFADEQSVVQTRFATSALTLLRASLGEAAREAVTASIADVARAVDAPLPDGALDAVQFAYLGTGWTVGLASEAALKMREAALFWSESYPAMEYRHGPISIAAPDTVTWMFGVPPEGLRAQVAATGATWVNEPGIDPLADLVRAQRVAIALAGKRGLDPDQPRNLTRSVILDQRP